MPLSDFVQITISIDSLGLARAGFGIPLVLSATAGWSERVRFYTDIPGVSADFAVGTPERLAATALFAQDNKPEQIAIGRSALKPTQQYTIGAAQVANSTAYNIHAIGPGVTETPVVYTSDSSATVQEIHNGLVTQLNAVVGKNFTAAFAPLVYADAVFTADNATEIFTITTHGLLTGDGPFQLTNAGGALPTGVSALTDYWIIKIDGNTFYLATSLANALAGTHLSISTNGTGTNTLSDTVATVSPTLPFLVTGNAAGNWFSLEVRDSAGLASNTAVTWLTNKQSHTDPGIQTDLDAIAAESSAWYALYTLYNSAAMVAQAAAWTEAQVRIYIPDVCDTATITAAVGGGDNLDALHTSAYDRTMGEYHPSPAAMLGAALMGQVLPLDPGSETWAFKQLHGPAPVQLTATHRVNLRAKNANTYEAVTSDANISWDGKTAGGEFLDTVRGLDSLRDDASKSILEALIANPKIPYTDAGASILGSELEGAMTRAANAGILALAPAPVVVVPKVASQSTANRAARKFVGLKGSGTLAGAIQDVTVQIVVTQ